MLTCADAEPLIARLVDGHEADAALASHLERCEACRAALADQGEVRARLRGRPPVRVSATFASRLAERIEQHRAQGWLGLANWRAWTVGLAPLAGALVLMAYLGSGSQAAEPTATPASTPASSIAVDGWPSSSTPRTPASMLMQSGSSGEVLLEAVLTGAVPASAGEIGNER